MSILRFLAGPLRWLLSRDPGLFEVVSGMATLGWGLLALQTFPPDDAPATLETIIQVGMQVPAGVFAIGLGLGQMFVLDLIDSRWRVHYLRLAAAALSVSFWSLLAASVARAGWPYPPAAMATFALCVGNLVLIPRIKWGFR